MQRSDWDCMLEAGPDGAPEVRLGLRMVVGLAEAQARSIVAARDAALFRSVDDLAHRAGLNKRSLGLLAKARALQSLSGHRRLAQWEAQGVEQLPGMLAGTSTRDAAIKLPRPSEAQDIVADYRSLGLSLGRHPLELLRKRMEQLGVIRAADLAAVQDGSIVRVSGLVTHRQRPETASGVVFVSIEDESGVSNLIIWPRVLEEHRLPVLAARLMVVEGQVQSEQGVIHVVARKVRDYSAWLGKLAVSSRDFH